MPEIPGIPTFDSTAGDSSDEKKLPKEKPPKDWTDIPNMNLRTIQYYDEKEKKK